MEIRIDEDAVRRLQSEDGRSFRSFLTKLRNAENRLETEAKEKSKLVKTTIELEQELHRILRKIASKEERSLKKQIVFMLKSQIREK